MKIALIVPYFGKLPNYFQMFLDSCKINISYEWLIFTDDLTQYEYPNNVKRIEMSWQECVKLFQSRFDFKLALITPQKLCDFKCAYGYVFETYLKEYGWWGHCDLDQIFGKLDNFVTEEMLNKYDKLFSLGHLTIYKNTFENNRVFMESLNGKTRYQEVFTSVRGCGFDEWLPDNINDIFINTNRNLFLDNIGADINPYKTIFSLVFYDVDKRCYVHDKTKTSIFSHENGAIYQYYKDGVNIRRIEFPYVHLQKRKMKDKRKRLSSDKYFIVPNKFIDFNHDVNKIINATAKWNIINLQYFRTKYNSLKYRIKNKDWKFNNILRHKNISKERDANDS